MRQADQTGDLGFGPPQVDLSLKPGDGKAAFSTEDGVSVLIRNDYGRGKAILLNFAIGPLFVDWPAMYRSNHLVRTKDAPKVLWFFRELLGEVPLAHPVRVRPALPLLRRFVFQSGKNQYVGLLQDLPEPIHHYAGRFAKSLVERQTTVIFDEPSHLYDARDRQYLGFDDKVTTGITPGMAKVFSLLPYRVTGMTVKMPDPARQGDPVNFDISLATTGRPGRHVLPLAWLDPAGRSLRHYTSNVNGNSGVYSGTLPLALNEKPGPCRMVVIDAATGL